MRSQKVWRYLESCEFISWLCVMNLGGFAKRCLPGMAVGVFLALMVWSYSIFFGSSISVVQGLLGTLGLAIACGVMTATTSLEAVIDRLPFL